ASANLFNLDASRLNPAEADPNLQDISSKFSPNIGAGVYWHGDQFYAGLSVPNFFQTTAYSDNDFSVYKERMNIYLITGYVMDLSHAIKFKPALLTKMVTGSPLQIDVSANFLIHEKFVLGAAYRWDAAVSGMAGFQITDGLFLGYGSDFDTTRLRHYNSGSHEFFLRFELFNKFDRITTPRFF